jgi:ribonuclease P protein subunit RPR2
MNKNKGLIKEVAAERIEILYSLSLQTVKDEPELSRRYALLMKRISTHYKVSLPRNIKRSICRGCGTVLVPGVTSTVRLASSKGYVIHWCKGCGTEVHFPYKEVKGR